MNECIQKLRDNHRYKRVIFQRSGHFILPFCNQGFPTEFISVTLPENYLNIECDYN